MTEFTDGTAKLVVTQSLGVLPGTITAFSGTFNNGYPVDKNTGLVNVEWHLCDGTNGTPDLRSRFIYGGDGTDNGATGGEASHKLTESELPALSGSLKHAVVWNDDFTATGILRGSYKGSIRFDSSARENNYDAQINVNFGGNQPHNNMPPYIACYGWRRTA